MKYLFVIFLIVLTNIAFAQVPRQTPKINKDGMVEIAGQRVRCENVRIRLDNRLDNLGMSDPEQQVIIINPYMLSYWEGVVQLFVFYHECGHMYNDASETGSDCWSVRKGIEDGWLTRKTMNWVCNSFGNEPAYGPYPSGEKRCAIAQACYAKEIKAKRDAIRKSD